MTPQLRFASHIGELRSQAWAYSAISPPSPSTDVVVQSDRPDVAESLALIKAAKACPYRATFPPCGCSGVRCGIKNGKIVSQQDCIDCVKNFG